MSGGNLPYHTEADSNSVFFQLYQKIKPQGLGNKIEQVNLIPHSNSSLKQFYSSFPPTYFKMLPPTFLII